MDLLFENTELIKFEAFLSQSVDYEIDDSSKKLVILSQKDYSVFEELLHKILKAVGFHPSSLCIINRQKSNRFPLYKLVKSQQFNQILVFGIDPQTLSLPIHLKINKSYGLEDFTVQFTSSLKEMNDNQAAKKLFWSFAKNQLLK